MTTETQAARGLENVVVASTKLSAIDGTAGHLSYAGYNIHDLADCYVRVTEQQAKGIFHAVDDTNETLLGCALGVASALNALAPDALLTRSAHVSLSLHRALRDT